jgi:hypothetical protein
MPLGANFGRITLTLAPPQIIYDDAQIRVIWQQGDSDFVLITFGDLLTVVDGLHFFASKPAAKARLNCIGVVATGGNFYPKSSMQAAAPAILTLIGRFTDRVVYGGSMGGYGAIKYSALLGATEVIALCPQWSIDPEECEGNFPGWPQLLTPALAGMGVLSAEISGAVFVFSDLFDDVDRFQAGMLRRVDPAAVIINVPMVAHHVTGVYAGTQVLLALIDASRRRDVPALIRLTRTVRQNHRRRLTGLIERAIGRHPGLTYDIMARRPSPDPAIGPLGAQHLFRAARHLTRHGDRGAATAYIETYRYELRDPFDIIQAALLLGHLADRALCVTTHHNTILVYDASQQVCIHVKPSKTAPHAPVRLQMTGIKAGFFAVLGGVRVDLGIGENASLTARPAGPQPIDWPLFEIGARYNGSNTFSADGFFLSAEPEGNIACNRATPYEWEHFRLR